MSELTQDNFLGLSPEFSAFDRAGVLVLPIPYEETVSYGGGTADGPAAIIAASQQVELYDREHDCEPALRYGVHTLPPANLPDGDPVAAVDASAKAVETAARTGKLVVGLGRTVPGASLRRCQTFLCLPVAGVSNLHSSILPKELPWNPRTASELS